MTKRSNRGARSASPVLPPTSKNPTLLQINTRIWLEALACDCEKTITLANVPDWFFKDLAERKIEWVWLLSVWAVSRASRDVARKDAGVRKEVLCVLEDASDADICGSGFAIAGYRVATALGGERALLAFRHKLAEHGVRLMLDFVPNHTGLGHPWVKKHPDYFVKGDAAQLERNPQNYIVVGKSGGNPIILAHGRDPNFPGWTDTLQLDYTNPDLQAAQTDELLKIAQKCDGVRCDMAMLLLPDVFERTWGKMPAPFWPGAISAVRDKHPRFTFLAEAYWHTEAELMQQGFDYCYDKNLYDQLVDGSAPGVRKSLAASPDYQSRLVRFLENHDEMRAIKAFDWPRHQAAAIIAYLVPGMRFFQMGQETGAKFRVPMQLCRGPREDSNAEIMAFYDRLFALLYKHPTCRNANWAQIEPIEAWQDNPTFDNFVAYTWCDNSGLFYVVVVNYSDQKSQCYLPLDLEGLAGKDFLLVDEMGLETYQRQGEALNEPGLYIELEPWRYNVFCLIAQSTSDHQ